MNRINIPNLITGLRILLIPVLVIVFYTAPLDWRYLASAIVFTVAAITDWLDGYLARKWDQASAFGAFIDPVADKLIVAVALVLILFKTNEWYILLPVVIIIGREITVSALREWMAELGSRSAIKVSYVGKLKTAFQMLSIACLLYHSPAFDLPIFEIGVTLLYVAAGLTISSMLSYLKAAWPILTS